MACLGRSAKPIVNSLVRRGPGRAAGRDRPSRASGSRRVVARVRVADHVTVASQPSGTVTLLFSDIEGSTRLLERLGSETYAGVLEQHRRLLREVFARHEGYEVDTEGDAFFVTFARAGDAIAAAEEAQQALGGASWPAEGMEVRVRMGLHTGAPLLSGPKYVGMDVHRAARIMAAGHGGQVLLSQSTRALVEGRDLRDL